MGNRYISLQKGIKWLIFAALSGLFSSCSPRFATSMGPENLLVIFEHSEFAHRPEILVQDMGLDTAIAPVGDLEFAANASTAVWIGREFPFEKAIEVITISKRYYSELRYIALSDYKLDPPDSAHYEIYVGGSTDTALRLGLKSWSDLDFKKLRAVQTREEYISLIESHYPKEPPSGEN